MTVRDMLGGGARLVRTQPKALALWALLYLVVALAMAATMWPTMAAMADLQRQVAAGAPGTPPPPLPPAAIAGLFLMELLFVAAMVAIFAAAMRAVHRGGSDWFGFLRLGMDELRLLALGILLWLFQTAAGFVVILVGVLIAAALYAALSDTAALPAWLAALVPLLLIAAMVPILWATVRLSLAGGFTVLARRIEIGPAWRATRGYFWTLFAGYLVIGLVYAVVSAAMTAILFPDLLRLYAALLRQDDPNAALAFQQEVFARMTLGPRMIAAMLLGAVVNTVLVGWLFGAIGTATILLDREARA